MTDQEGTRSWRPDGADHGNDPTEAWRAGGGDDGAATRAWQSGETTAAAGPSTPPQGMATEVGAGTQAAPDPAPASDQEALPEG